MEKSADAMLATEWWRASDADVLTAIRELEHLSRRVYAVTLAVQAEAQSRGLNGGYDCTRVAVHDAARIPITEAIRRENHTDLLAHSERAQAAMADGALGADHLDVIVKTLAKIPENVGVEQRDLAESTLVDNARTLDARGLKCVARQVLAWLDQDGPEPVDPQEPPANELHVDTLRNGDVRFVGPLSAEAGALLIGLLSPLAKPHPADGVRDWRGAAERQGDAFVELLHLTANAAATPVDGGERPHLTLTMPLADLREQIGHAQLGLADPGGLSARQVRRIACDAKIIPMVLDGDSQPLDVGRAKRTAPPGVRKALVWRDGGCSFPTCDRRPEWTDAHHVKHWIDGGPTTVANMTLLCRRHHTLIHQSDWEVRIREGLPEFLPPAFIDPECKPRRNTLHGVRSLPRRGQKCLGRDAARWMRSLSV